VHGGSGIAPGLIEQLRAARPDAKFLELVHRLDRETSGVLLIAKKRRRWSDCTNSCARRVRQALSRAGARPLARREAPRAAVAAQVFHQGWRTPRARRGRGGMEAETIFRRKATWFDRDPPLALLEAELKTGRTHQIRVHLTHLGFPLAGDDKYGDFAWNKVLAKQGLKRMFLHSRSLGLRASGHRRADGIRVPAAARPRAVCRAAATRRRRDADA
jgi:23S rRNA pseudouridine955/2504/2580 synthase